jgi:hypothetical protein
LLPIHPSGIQRLNAAKLPPTKFGACFNLAVCRYMRLSKVE